MRFTNKTKIKGQEPRKTGYYWVVWAMDADGVTECRRIGYYNGKLGQWYLPGDNRGYFDDDLVNIYEIPVTALPGVSLWMRILVIAAAAIVLYTLSGYVKSLIAFIFK